MLNKYGVRVDLLEDIFKQMWKLLFKKMSNI